MSRAILSTRALVILAAAGHVLIMSFTHVFGRKVLAEEKVPPEITVSLRCLVAAAVLLASYAAWRPRPVGGPLRKNEWLVLLVIMLLAVPFNQFFYILGLKFAPAVHSSLLFCTTPLVISALDAIFFGRRAPRATWAGAAMAFCGVLLALEEQGLNFASDALKGDLILSVSVLAWSILTLLSRPLLKRVPNFAFARLTLLGGTAMLLPLTLRDLVAFDYSTLSSDAILFIVFLGVVTSVVSYLNWFFLMSHMGAVRSGMLLTLQPVTTAVLAWWLLGEPLTPQLAVGGAIVLLGMFLVHASEARSERARASTPSVPAASGDAPAAVCAATAEQSAAMTKNQ